MTCPVCGGKSTVVCCRRDVDTIIRRRKCWRLMGFNDEDFDKASRVCSNMRLYKQAGNSIVVDVLEAIFKQLF